MRKTNKQNRENAGGMRRCTLKSCTRGVLENSRTLTQQISKRDTVYDQVQERIKDYKLGKVCDRFVELIIGMLNVTKQSLIYPRNKKYQYGDYFI